MGGNSSSSTLGRLGSYQSVNVRKVENGYVVDVYPNEIGVMNRTVVFNSFEELTGFLSATLGTF